MSSPDQVVRERKALDDGVYLALEGDIDLSRSPALRGELMSETAKSPSRLVIDLAGVPYMDSSGVATLVEALQQQRRGSGKMILCGLQPKVRSIFEIAKLDMVFTIVDDHEAARSA